MMELNTRLYSILIMTKYQSTKKGFTLLELLAVMGIMLIMATIGITAYRGMVTGSGITASLGHLRQTLSLARQQAIMQGKNAYVVFVQTTNESWYVTCLGQGTKTDRYGSARYLVDKYESELGQVASSSVLFNLSKDKAVYGQTFSEVSSAPIYDSALLAWEIVVDDPIWTDGARYGWEVSKRVQLPRGFRFVESPPSTVRFKPNGTTCDVKGNFLGDEHDIEIREETRTNHIYTVRFNMNGSTEVIY